MNLFFRIGLIIFLLFSFKSNAQQQINWLSDGVSFTSFVDGNLVRTDPKNESEVVLVKKEQLIPEGASMSLLPDAYTFSDDNTKLLLFVNTAKVWRYNTRGDYWLLNIAEKKLRQIGNGLPSQSLMFAKFSPDGKNVAYVSYHNLYSEDLSSGNIRKLTLDGSRKINNGTFDWVYEEEFGCRDGFRWCPDSRQIAYWQVDASKIRDFYLINNTDSAYSIISPIEYPKVGEHPSAVKIGVVSVYNSITKWMKVEGDPRNYYLPRMEWSATNELVLQQLNRKQQESKLMYCNTLDGSTKTFWAESDDAWVDLNTMDPSGWDWINKGQDFLWVSEKDGWRHVYKISKEGKNVVLLTKGNYDIAEIKGIDEDNNYLYFSASPYNATQLYLYRVRLNNPLKQYKDEPELLGDISLKGTHQYQLSPKAKMAWHSFSNANHPSVSEWVLFPEDKVIKPGSSIKKNLVADPNMNIVYTKITTIDSVDLDVWINKPKNFIPQKKYPVVFYVYGEPAASTIDDVYGNHDNYLYDGSMSKDGYIQIGLDNRGTPSLKGAAWRKSIYKKDGQINIRDLAMGIKKILEFDFIDKDRVAVWGWSGGGSSTLNLMFQYPDLCKTGVAIAPITDLLYYDNIYTERYMGLPQENADAYKKGSAITYAKGLKGNLLLIHGTGDDNVHYSNSEKLVNELIKYNKQFQLMVYPNRTHSLSEGKGTFTHLSTLYSNFIRNNCPPGPKQN